MIKYEVRITHPTDRESNNLLRLNPSWPRGETLIINKSIKDWEGVEEVWETYSCKEEAEEMVKYLNKNYAFINIRMNKIE